MDTVKVEDIFFTGLFVDNPAKLLELFPPKHSRAFAHHSTNRFKPKDTNNLEIGTKSLLKIIGRAFDEKGDAVLVENPKSENTYPHITISCFEGVDPFYSNELIEKAKENNSLHMFPEPLYIEVTEGYGDMEGNAILSKE